MSIYVNWPVSIGFSRPIQSIVVMTCEAVGVVIESLEPITAQQPSRVVFSIENTGSPGMWGLLSENFLQSSTNCSIAWCLGEASYSSDITWCHPSIVFFFKVVEMLSQFNEMIGVIREVEQSWSIPRPLNISLQSSHFHTRLGDNPAAYKHWKVWTNNKIFTFRTYTILWLMYAYLCNDTNMKSSILYEIYISVLLMAEILHHLGCMKPYEIMGKTSTG